jgi:uncharacterized membrane protein HdeD (DUF308 family)
MHIQVTICGRRKFKMIKYIKEYMKRTWKNKLVAIALGLLGYITTLIDNDCTAFVFLLMIAFPIFIVDAEFITPKEEE